MTAQTTRTNRLPLLLLLVLPLLLGAYLALNLLGATVRARPEHSVKEHGELEVGQIHQKLSCGGPLATFKSLSWKRPNTHFFVCETEPGQFGLLIADKVKGGRWLEITTFMLGNADRAKEYLSARAVYISGTLPWEITP